LVAVRCSAHGHGGEGHEGSRGRSCSILHAPQDPSDPFYELRRDPRSVWYWKREFLLAQSGLLEQLPRGLSAARTYQPVEDAETAWLWMEHLVDSTPARWRLKHFCFAARQLGRYNRY
jgi:hypothetical protein